MSAEIELAVETVTPDLASKYLEANIENRRMSRSKMVVYADAIKRGEWVVNGETIKFDVDGRLLDGQHRLAAIVHADTSVDVCVVRGLSRATFATMDTGRNRTAGDILSILKIPQATNVASGIRLIWLYRFERFSLSVGTRQRMSHMQMLKIIDDEPGILADCREALSKRFRVGLLPASVNIFIWHMAKKLDEDLAIEFLEPIASGECIKGSAADCLLWRLQDTDQEYIKPSTSQKLAWAIHSWNAHFAGVQIERLPRLLERGLPRLDPCPIGHYVDD